MTEAYERVRDRAAELERTVYTLWVALKGTTELAQRYHELFGYPDAAQVDMAKVDQQIKQGLDAIALVGE